MKEIAIKKYKSCKLMYGQVETVQDYKSCTAGLQDEIIESQDYSDMENAVSSVLQGYVTEDITGDGLVESLDYSIMENRVYEVVLSIHP